MESEIIARNEDSLLYSLPIELFYEILRHISPFERPIVIQSCRRFWQGYTLLKRLKLVSSSFGELEPTPDQRRAFHFFIQEWDQPFFPDDHDCERFSIESLRRGEIQAPYPASTLTLRAPPSWGKTALIWSLLVDSVRKEKKCAVRIVSQTTDQYIDELNRLFPSLWWENFASDEQLYTRLTRNGIVEGESKISLNSINEFKTSLSKLSYGDRVKYLHELLPQLGIKASTPIPISIICPVKRISPRHAELYQSLMLRENVKDDFPDEQDPEEAIKTLTLKAETPPEQPDILLLTTNMLSNAFWSFQERARRTNRVFQVNQHPNFKKWLTELITIDYFFIDEAQTFSHAEDVTRQIFARNNQVRIGCFSANEIDIRPFSYIRPYRLPGISMHGLSLRTERLVFERKTVEPFIPNTQTHYLTVEPTKVEAKNKFSKSDYKCQHRQNPDRYIEKVAEVVRSLKGKTLVISDGTSLNWTVNTTTTRKSEFRKSNPYGWIWHDKGSKSIRYFTEQPDSTNPVLISTYGRIGEGLNMYMVSNVVLVRPDLISQKKYLQTISRPLRVWNRNTEIHIYSVILRTHRSFVETVCKTLDEEYLEKYLLIRGTRSATFRQSELRDGLWYDSRGALKTLLPEEIYILYHLFPRDRNKGDDMKRWIREQNWFPNTDLDLLLAAIRS